MQSLVDILASIPDSPRGILQFVMNLLLTHGYVVIFVGAALDNFGLPASGDVVLFAGGWFSNVGRAALPPVMLSGFAGALTSDNAVYWIGRIGGRPLIDRVLKMRFLHFLINEKNLARAERYFESHGGKTVFVGRFGPGLRSM
ncbi:MAG: DedA family protein, partial [Actinomycetota bacterium]|nr:DedA family protein [Actinomycetota bacterium]